MQHQNLQHILCSDAHEGGKYFFKKGPKTHKIQGGGMFTWKFKMVRRFDFLKIFVIPGGNAPPKKPNGGIVLPPFQIEVGGTKEQPPPLG